MTCTRGGFSCWHRGHFIQALTNQIGDGRDGGTKLAPGHHRGQ